MKPKNDGLCKFHSADITDQKQGRAHLFQAQATTPHRKSKQQSTNQVKRLNLNRRQKKIVIKDMTFVSIPQPSEYAFQYAELQAAEEDLVALFEVLNTKKV